MFLSAGVSGEVSDGGVFQLSPVGLCTGKFRWGLSACPARRHWTCMEYVLMSADTLKYFKDVGKVFRQTERRVTGHGEELYDFEDLYLRLGTARTPGRHDRTFKKTIPKLELWQYDAMDAGGNGECLPGAWSWRLRGVKLWSWTLSEMFTLGSPK